MSTSGFCDDRIKSVLLKSMRMSKRTKQNMGSARRLISVKTKLDLSSVRVFVRNVRSAGTFEVI